MGRGRRYKEDAALMKAISLKACRLSAAWTKSIPEGSGQASQKGLGFCSRLVDELLEAGIEPRGGWLAGHAKAVAGRLGGRVKHWITFNRPRFFIGLGYSNGAALSGAWRAGGACLLQKGRNKGRF